MSNDSILAGLRIVEASAFVAAPLGGMTLAQLGAEVIRIDALGGGPDYRRWPVTDDNVSLFWCGLNKSKRSVAIDIASPEGRELAMALICAPGDDAGMQSACRSAFLTGSGDANEAVNHVLPAWDLVTGQMAATGLLAAERHRRLNGVGQHVSSRSRTWRWR